MFNANDDISHAGMRIASGVWTPLPSANRKLTILVTQPRAVMLPKSEMNGSKPMCFATPRTSSSSTCSRNQRDGNGAWHRTRVETTQPVQTHDEEHPPLARRTSPLKHLTQRCRMAPATRGASTRSAILARPFRPSTTNCPGPRA